MMPLRLQKRINFEIELINDIKNCVCQQDSHDESKINIYIYKNKYIINLVVKITNRYPFSPPDTSIWGAEINDYHKILCTMQCNFNSFNKDVCLCCNTIICKNKWEPTNKLIDIVREVDKIFDVCHKEIKNKIRDKILLKHLGYII